MNEDTYKNIFLSRNLQREVVDIREQMKKQNCDKLKLSEKCIKIEASLKNMRYILYSISEFLFYCHRFPDDEKTLLRKQETLTEKLENLLNNLLS